MNFLTALLGGLAVLLAIVLVIVCIAAISLGILFGGIFAVRAVRRRL